jgi:superfamily II DNA or RNA helicase
MEEAKIVIKDAVWSQVQDITLYDLEKLKMHMKIRDVYSPFGFKRKDVKDTGWVNFLSDDGFFLTGLIPEMELALSRLGIPYEIYKVKTLMSPIKFNEDLLRPELVEPRPGKYLREDQLEFLQRFMEHRRGIVHASTGFGKTAIMVAILKMLPPKTPALVIINSLDLIDQTFGEFSKLGVPENKLGIFTGSTKNANMITITTSDSLPNLIDLLPHIRLLIADEAHTKIVSKSVVPYLRMMKSATDRMALSATPWKKKDKPHNWKLKGHFGIVLGEAKTKPLQEAGILSASRTHFHVVSGEKMHYDYKEAYDKLIVENLEWHDKVANLVSKMKGRTLIRVERKDHGMHLVDRIHNAIWVSGDDKKVFRREVREKLQSSTEDIVVVATRIFNTGVDIYIHNLVNCAGLQSDIATIQGYGRGLRLAPDKEYVDYHDFYHETNDHLKRHAKERIKTLEKEGHQITYYDL